MSVQATLAFANLWRETTNDVFPLNLERFSNDCRKTKAKAITPTNHDRGKQRDEPITIPSNYLKLARSAGKMTRRRWDWFWFCFSLVEKLARVTKRSNRNHVITFDSHLKTALYGLKTFLVS